MISTDHHSILKRRPGLFRRGTLIVMFLALTGCQSAQTTPESGVPAFMPELGKHHYPITTSAPAAQRHFDQGLILTFGFNHAEAARSFQKAYELDPNCALCYWGEALVLGPNINAPMDPAAAPKAFDLVHKALAVTDGASDKEKALIQALSKRYAKAAPDDRSPLDKAYAASMRDVSRRFPDDAVIASLFAEALMDLHPWNFWSKEGEARPWTAEIVSTLEHALQLDAENPLANHLYIHALEASPHPEKALPSARRLPSLAPGSGHLVHMPAHIFIRTGHYRDAILANQAAVRVDRGYLSHDHAESIYTLAYVPHNHHFLWAAAIKTGRRALAMEAAVDTARHVNRDMLRTPGFSGTLQHFQLIPLYTRALFGDWDAILKEPAPAPDLLYPTGIWHYARGLALVRQGKKDAAAQELAKLEQTIASPAIANLTVFDLNPVKSLLQIGADLLLGELAAHERDFDSAVAHLQKAVKLEDDLNYTEPKDWYLPPRQVLGSVLLAMGRPAEAEKAYRQDLAYHPQNGWSLFGLLRTLREQGNNNEADSVQKQFDEVWSDADVTLTDTRF
ncbi:MAG: tetratricopeptide repeat protein [Gammaproteobacteria bacterium]